ncbi:hypothetical protein HYC85_015277 [Camellia sinensis]|uniref:SBP-type domain-containing protein n=1 Tax=Camellia sinensis TaxID=4442 RepID=A0A7J7GWC0_CAMSI|nr:hypothetical protein HYC85_015277 [Camellia sinensis]
MENGNWSLFNSSSSNNNNSTTCGSSRGQNSNCNNNLAWDTWELGTSLFGWGSSSSTTPNNNNNNNPFYQTATNTTTATTPKPRMLNYLYGGGAGGSHIHPDPHLMCLKLGKRQYFEDVMASPLGDCHVGGLSVKKRGRGVARPPPSTAAVVVAKCRVEGCEVGLGKAKEYHRRHKVCEIHSKAEKAVVHGVDQRFCQQCSRFHEVSEFDGSKRSCRRRLVGHNQRRRKRSLHSIATNPFQDLCAQSRHTL